MDPAEKQARKQFANLIHRLNSENPSARLAAREELGQMGPEAPRRLRIYLEDMAHIRRREPIVILGVIFIGAILSLCFHIDTTVLFMMIPSAMVLFFSWRQRYGVATGALARFEDVQDIGLVLDALDVTDPSSRIDISNALVRLLPRLTVRDASWLNQRQRERLCKLLAGATTELAIEILKVLEQIGDEAALPYAQRLTVAPDPMLRQAAAECLLFIQQRAEEKRAHQTLLRPSSASEVTPEYLLRPGVGPSEVEPQQLLRPPTIQDYEC